MSSEWNKLIKEVKEGKNVTEFTFRGEQFDAAQITSLIRSGVINNREDFYKWKNLKKENTKISGLS